MHILFQHAIFIILIVYRISDTSSHVLPPQQMNMSDSELESLIHQVFGINGSDNHESTSINTTSSDNISEINTTDTHTTENYSTVRQSEGILSPLTLLMNSSHTAEKREADLISSTAAEDQSLLEDDNLGCICVPIDECDPSNRTISPNLEGLIDERSRTCERPNEVLCGCGNNNNQEEQIHSHDDKTSSSNQLTGETKHSHYGSTSNQLSDKFSSQQGNINTGSGIGNSFGTSEDFNCVCQKENTLSNHQSHGSAGHHSHPHKNEDHTGTTHRPSEEMYCVCKQTKGHSHHPHQETSYGHHTHEQGNKGSSYQQSEELHCVCQHGQMQSTTHWSYGETHHKGDKGDIGSSHYTSGQSNFGNSHSYTHSHSQSSSSTNNDHQGDEHNDQANPATLPHYPGGLNHGNNSENEGNSGSADSYSHTQAQSHSTAGSDYDQRGDTNENAGTSYQTTHDVNYGKHDGTDNNKGVTGTSYSYSNSQASSQASAGSYSNAGGYTHSIEENTGAIHQTTDGTDHDHKYTSGLDGSTGTTNSFSHSESQSGSHSSGETNYAHSQNEEDKTTTTHYTTEKTNHGEHDYTMGTDGTAGSSHSYTDSQSQSHYTGETNHGNDHSHSTDDNTSGLHATDETDEKQHLSGTEGSTSAVHSYSHSQAEAGAHSSTGTSYGQDTHLHSQEGSSSLHQHGEDQQHGHTSGLGDTANTGTTHSYSHSQAEAESHSSTGTGYDQDINSHIQQSSTAGSEHQHGDENHSHGYTTGTEDSTKTTNSYSHSQAAAESHSSTGTIYDQNTQSHTLEGSSNSEHKHTDGHTSTIEDTASTGIHSSVGTSSGEDTHSHEQEEGTIASHYDTDKNDHGQNEHVQSSDGTTGTSGSYSHSAAQSHASAGSTYNQDTLSHGQQSSTGTSNQHTDEKYQGQHEHATGTEGSAGTSDTYSHSQSQSSTGIDHGQDSHYHSEQGSTDSLHEHSDDKKHSQHEYNSGSGTSNVGISNSHSQSESHSTAGTSFGEDGHSHSQEGSHTHSSTGTDYGHTHNQENSGSASSSHSSSQSSAGSFSNSLGSSDQTSYGQHGYDNNKYNYSSNLQPDGLPKDYIGCGYPKDSDVAQRIKSDSPDSESLFGQYPWMVAILTKTKDPADENKDTLTFVCGGSLIHNQVVLTATHCLVRKDVKTLVVRAGEWNVQANDEIIPYQQAEVEKVIRHPDYYSGALYNDVSLIFIKKPFHFADNVDIICLPPPNLAIDYTEKCLVSGWGKESIEKSSKFQPILRQVELPLVSREHCQNKLRKTRLGPKFNLHDSFICAGGEINEDTCKGDGGGPLVCPIKGSIDRYHQLGIVSWGIGCGTDTPAVYVNVKSFISWIDEQMHKLNLKPHYHY